MYTSVYIYSTYTNNPRSHPTSSQPATTPTKAPQAPSSATYTTHRSFLPQQHPTSTTSTSAPVRTPTMGALPSSSNDQDSPVWRFSLQQEQITTVTGPPSQSNPTNKVKSKPKNPKKEKKENTYSPQS